MTFQICLFSNNIIKLINLLNLDGYDSPKFFLVNLCVMDSHGPTTVVLRYPLYITGSKVYAYEYYNLYGINVV